MRKKNEITRKLALLLCAVLAAGVVITGCGSSSSASAPAEEATEAVSEATEETTEAVSEAVEEEVPVVEETATTEAAALSATAAEGATVAAINDAAFAQVFNGGVITDVTSAGEETTVEAQEITEDTINAAASMTKGDVYQDNPSVSLPKLTPPFTTPEQSLIYLMDYIRTSSYTQDVYIYCGYEDGIDVFVLCSVGGKKIGVDTIYESDLTNARAFGVMRNNGVIASSDEYGNSKIEKY